MSGENAMKTVVSCQPPIEHLGLGYIILQKQKIQDAKYNFSLAKYPWTSHGELEVLRKSPQ